MARVATRLGVKAQAMFFAGGEAGRALEASVREEGVEVITCPVGEPTRQCFTIDERSSGRQFRFILPGASVSAAERDQLIELVGRHARGHRHVVISGSMPEGTDDEFLGVLVRCARGRGAEVVVDTSGPALLVAARLGALLLKPSQRELGAAVGRPLTTTADISAAAHQLLSMAGGRAVVVSRGATGALLVRPGEPDVAIAAPPVESLSVIGAGDSMVAAIVVAIERGYGLPDAVRYGVAAGSATVARRGSTLCRADDVERLHREMGVSNN